MTNALNIAHTMNVTERELDAHQRRQRVDAVLAACASDSERTMVAHMTLTHRDFIADGFARRHAGSAVAAHAAVPAKALIMSARGIARSASETADASEGCRKLRTAISHIASAVSRATGGMMIASGRGMGGRHGIEEGRRLLDETYRPSEEDADALLGEALGLLEECEDHAVEPENFKKLCMAGALLEMLLDEIVPAYTVMHPELIATPAGEVDDRYAMPPIEQQAARRGGLSDMEREICERMNVTSTAYLAQKAKRQ